MGVTAVSTCCHAIYSYQAVITYAGGFTENDLTSYVDDAAAGVCCTDDGCPAEQVVVDTTEETVELTSVEVTLFGDYLPTDDFTVTIGNVDCIDNTITATEE
jgi:hypothetical protein